MSDNIDANDELVLHGERRVMEALERAQDTLPPLPPVEAYGEPSEAEPMRLSARQFVYRDPATIPRRQFLYGYELRRGQLSAVVAPGAAGKTTFKVGRAICMALGRDLLGHRVWNGPHRVWLWNLEDEMEEVEKTVHAFIKEFDIDPADLGDRLFIDGSDSVGAGALKLAVEDSFGGVKLQRPVSDALLEELKRLKIDYLDIDPFVSSHAVDENSNQAIDAVAKEWLRIAQQANCAVSLAHHLRKSTATEFTANDARGAGAMINAARSVLVLQRMAKEDADKLQIPACDRKKYFSVYDDKNNKAPAAATREWYQFIGVGLGNADVGSQGPEDSIAAVRRWTPPDVFGGVTTVQLLNIQRIVDGNPEKARKHSASKNWVGKIVAHVLDRNLDQSGAEATIKEMVRVWLDNGALRTVVRQNEKREPVEYVEVGEWAVVE